MKKAAQHYHYWITPLSPIHIGDGSELCPTDYVINANKVQLFEPTLPENLHDELLTLVNNNVQLHQLQTFFKRNIRQLKIRHAIPTTTALQQEYNKLTDDKKINKFAISRMIRHPYNEEAYIPGSSLKGAITTSWLASLSANNQNMLLKNKLETKKTALDTTGKKRIQLEQAQYHAIFPTSEIIEKYDKLRKNTNRTLAQNFKQEREQQHANQNELRQWNNNIRQLKAEETALKKEILELAKQVNETVTTNLYRITGNNAQEKMANDPRRLLKISDAQPTEKIKKAITYSVNISKGAAEPNGVNKRVELICAKQYRAFKGEISIQAIIEQHHFANLRVMPHDWNKLVKQSNQRIINQLIENDLPKYKTMGLNQLWITKFEEIITQTLHAKLDDGSMMLIRLGMASSAELKTLDGYRSILIKEKPLYRAGYYNSERAFTTWLTSNQAKTLDDSYPFGWAIIEFSHENTPEDCEILQAFCGINVEQARIDKDRLKEEARQAALSPVLQELENIKYAFRFNKINWISDAGMKLKAFISNIENGNLILNELDKKAIATTLNQQFFTKISGYKDSKEAKKFHATLNTFIQ